MTETVSSHELLTYSFPPIADAKIGLAPTLIVLITLFFTVSITDRLLSPAFMT